MKDENQKIIEDLKKLPKINDTMNKEELYNKVSASFSRKNMDKRSDGWKNKLVPVFSTALVVVIMVILIPSFLDNDTTSSEQEILHRESESGVQGQNEFKMGLYQNEASNDAADVVDEYEHYILQTEDGEHPIAFAAFPDEQFQSVVPVTFVLSDESNDDNVQELIDDSWRGTENLLEGITFELDEENKQVIAHLPDDFSLGDGTARTYIFTELLSFIYSPIGFEKVVFSEGEIELGHFGVIEELDLIPLGKALYKLYQPSADSQMFFIPIRQDEDSSQISDAFEEMKLEEEAFQLQPTIPPNVNFDLEENGESLTVIFADETRLDDSQQTMTMIEAMLATAKAYGYQSVFFDNQTLDQVGSYDLTEPIPVPMAVNPIFK